MQNNTKGAWVIHHGKKIGSTQNAAATFPALDFAAKTGSLLAKLAVTKESDLNANLVRTLAISEGLNPLTDLPACLDALAKEKVIDRAADGSISVIGVTSNSALSHTARIFDGLESTQAEKGAIELGELASHSPVQRSLAAEWAGDTFGMTRTKSTEFLDQATDLGFVDSDGDNADPLLFNGNLFRRDSIAKTNRVLSSLNPAEQTAFVSFQEHLAKAGAVTIEVAEKMLGTTLLSKVRAAAIFDENIVSNEAGDHSFITAPGAFHKFVDPLIDDAFDQAKALVAALSYGMIKSSQYRGQIWGVSLLLRKLLRGQSVGPAPAIGKDYRALEIARVVQIEQTGSSYRMRLLKMEVGEIALQVLSNGDASAETLVNIPGAQVTGYTGPEAARSKFKKKKEVQPTKSQMRSLISSVRTGSGL